MPSACKPTQSRRRRCPHLTATRRISHKISQRHLRQPLAIRNVNSTSGVQQEPTTNIPFPTWPPRTLPPPQRREINREFINTNYPDLVEVPTEYIRTTALAATGPEYVLYCRLSFTTLLTFTPSSMFAALAHVKAQPSTDSLSRELEITMNGAVAAHCPTHMLAIYSNQSPTLKRRITLFPIHDLVLVVHCAHLPRLPATVSNVTGATVKLPVVPMCLPSPETFNILQAYLYTKRLDMLFSSLIPPPPSFDNPNTTMPEIISRLTHHLSATCSKVQLAERAIIINGLWRNVCALGVQDDKLWNAIGVTWEAVAGAIRSL